jgi:hypothetical protein
MKMKLDSFFDDPAEPDSFLEEDITKAQILNDLVQDCIIAMFDNYVKSEENRKTVVKLLGYVKENHQFTKMIKRNLQQFVLDKRESIMLVYQVILEEQLLRQFCLDFRQTLVQAFSVKFKGMIKLLLTTLN